MAYALRAKRAGGVAFGGNDTRGPLGVAAALNAHGAPTGRQDFGSETFICFDPRQADVLIHGERSGPLDTKMPGPAIAFNTTHITSPMNRCNPQPHDPCHPLAAQAHPPALAVPTGATDWAVRRLTPTECERLQGFPDGHTAGQADGPRYRQLGNSKAVPVVRWLGARLLAADQQPTQPTLQAAE